MNHDSVPIARPRPSPFDIVLVAIGPVILAVGDYMFRGSPWRVAQGFVAGCVLGAIAWRWPRIMGPVLLVLSIPALAYSLIFTLYTFGMPNWLVSLWGSAAFLAGGVGVLRWHSTTQRPVRHIAVQAGLVGFLAAVLLLYFLILWPPQGKAILISLPIMKQAVAPQVQLGAGGVWAVCWTTPRVTVPEALESAKNLLESDGWTIVDTALYTGGISLISAQRGAYTLEVIYDPGASSHSCSTSADTGAYIAAYVRRAQARQFTELDQDRWCGLAISCLTVGTESPPGR
jgi:hypothetical protein